jgi:hypothetical protein
MPRPGARRPRLSARERVRMVAIETALQAYVQARTRHTASYPTDLVAAQAAAADLAHALRTLADLAPTSRELQGLADQWETSRSRHAARGAAPRGPGPAGATGEAGDACRPEHRSSTSS